MTFQTDGVASGIDLKGQIVLPDNPSAAEIKKQFEYAAECVIAHLEEDEELSVSP